VLGLGLSSFGFSQTELTDETIESKLEANDGKLSIIHFYTDWSGPCKRQAKIIKELMERFPYVHFYRINSQNNPKAPRKHRVRAYPTLLFMQNGKKVDQTIGFKEKDVLIELINKHTSH
jgi:thioredoxin 1